MRRRPRVVLSVFLVGVLAFLLWSVLRSGQPHYKGKSLYSWIVQHARASEAGDEKARNEAEIAIRDIGTNALPTLLHWITRRDSRLKKRLLENRPLGELVRWVIRLEPGHDGHWRTTHACGVLKSIAKPMVPDLIALLKDPDPYVRSSAVDALDQIGSVADEAIPALLESPTYMEARNKVWAVLKDLGIR